METTDKRRHLVEVGRSVRGSRGLRCLVMAILAVVMALGAFAPVEEARAATCSTSNVIIVAHEDDDLLFLNPDDVHAIKGGQCVRTVFVTAGDAGQGQSYWSGREAGARAAYAQMAGVPNSWSQSDAGLSGHPAPLYTLNSAPNVSLIFLRLPDGAPGGGGFGATGNTSLQKLWDGSIGGITAVNGTSSYTRASLIDTLTSIMSGAQATQIRAQDYLGGFGDGDHSDHHAAAYFARAAHQQYGVAHTFTGYQGYGTSSRPANVFGADMAAKQAAYFAYAPFDPSVCQTITACANNAYGGWLSRQYTVGVETSGSTSQDRNVAANATVTASSQNFSTGQTADKAVDGVVSDYPNDPSREWATVGGGAGSSLRLGWTSAVTLTRVVLHDRPNTNDRITSGTLAFSDGFTISVGALPDDGSGLTVTFPARSTTSLTFTITSVSATTVNIGLAEIEAWSPSSAPQNRAPVADAGPDQTVAPGSSVQLDGTSSFDPDGNAISFKWTQTAGPFVFLSNASAAQPSFVAPAGAATLGFQLVVSDGSSSSAPASVTITVIASVGGTNLADSATVSASSQNFGTGQTADKAVDGVADGFPNDYTKEWATTGGGPGSWLELDWSAPVTLSTVVLHDRPNANDRVNGATLMFSNGGILIVGPLPNDGSPLTISFPPTATTSLRFTVTTVSSTTVNVGLSEIEVWGTP
jgi:hypothetical protein